LIKQILIIFLGELNNILVLNNNWPYILDLNMQRSLQGHFVLIPLKSLFFQFDYAFKKKLLNWSSINFLFEKYGCGLFFVMWQAT